MIDHLPTPYFTNHTTQWAMVIDLVCFLQNWSVVDGENYFSKTESRAEESFSSERRIRRRG